MSNSQRPTEAAWVKGFIIGSASSATQLKDEDVASNIAIAESAESTSFVPVELKSNSIFREKLNVADNPANKGKEVKLYGIITDYFSTTGIKNLADAILDGETITTGISSVKSAAAQNGAIYNIAGQMVNKGYKGLVIQNGKKFFQK